MAAGAAAVVAVAVFAVTRLLGPDHLPGIAEGSVGVIDADIGRRDNPVQRRL